ncbi:BTAD domain-containing putative transcriptional regulator [Lentzea sp. NPDC051213]|uniref:AfsR/SARP family transcriptional regulator n=1 Tax=Lentzea sp. NPDC051213 TaxID=3364126 RepID=UPI0037886EAA
MLTFGVLGPLEVLRDGSAVHVNGPQQRALLATLLLRANTVVPVTVIVARLWDEDPPPAGRKSVQMYVLRLRRLLADGAVIETHPHGYLLRIDPATLDLARFRDAVRAAGLAQPRDELALLSQALQCWRGPMLDDVDSESLHREDVPPLAEQLLRVRERFFDASLELGQHGEVISELIRATEEHPWHEAFWAQLVTALHRTGRRADALQTYQTVRRRFAEELGVDPGSGLRAAHEAVLAADDPAPAVAQLPGDVNRFIGRDTVIAGLDEFAFTPGGDRNIVISGPPGVGKTTLAVHVAHRWREKFPDGQLYVNLQGFAADPPLSPSTALTRFLGALGFGRDRVPDDVEEQSALLRSALTGRRMVLVLDNAADADQVRPLLPGQPGCVVLITSRHDLRGLVVSPGASGVPLDVLDDDESRAVLADLLGPERAAAEAGALGQLAKTCAHLPLALRIAGANLAADPGCSIADYTTELTTRGRVTALAIDGDERNAVRAAFDQSYLRLNVADRALFRLLGLVPGPDIGVAATAALADTDVPHARRAVDRLVAAGLLQRTAPGRCGFHDLIREYAAGLAGVDGDPAMFRLVEHYLRRAAEAARIAYPVAAVRDVPADPALTEADAVRWFDDEHHNLLAVLTWAATRPAAQHLAWRMVEVLHGYLQIGGHTREAIATSTAALGAADAAGDHQARVSLLDLLGLLFHDLSEYDQAYVHHVQALTIARQLGDLDGEADALRNIGRQQVQQGRPQDALTYFDKALAVARSAGNTESESRTLNFIGVATTYSGDPQTAFDLHEQALALARKIDHRELVHRCLNGRGIAWWALGRLDESVADHEEVLAYCRQTGQSVGEGASLMSLAEVHLDAERADLAAGLAAEALLVSREVAERRTQANTITLLAAIDNHRGDHAEAATKCGQALELAREIGFGFGEVAALLGLATAHRGLGDPGTALLHAGKALELVRASRQLLLEADVLTELARDHLDLGDSTAAADTATEAVRVAANQGRSLVEQRARTLLAGLRSR